MFGKADFAAMARALRDLEGRFVLSLNDVPEVRQAFDGFRFVDATVSYTIAGDKPLSTREVIIMDDREGRVNLG